jgi:hypothetical protein
MDRALPAHHVFPPGEWIKHLRRKPFVIDPAVVGEEHEATRSLTRVRPLCLDSSKALRNASKLKKEKRGQDLNIEYSYSF